MAIWHPLAVFVALCRVLGFVSYFGRGAIAGTAVSMIGAIVQNVNFAFFLYIYFYLLNFN